MASSEAMKLITVLVSTSLGACASQDVSHPAYVLTPLTAATWTATVSGPARPLQTDPVSQALLRQAIEKASGCKVTDSDFSRDNRQFDAQVDCDGRLK